ncbi:TldD/PmbA family protein [soil metagenome]
MEKSDALALIKKIVSYSKADSVEIGLSGSISNNIRFAVNTVSTSGAYTDVNISISSNFGKRSGSVGLTSLDDDEIRKAVASSESIAKLAPENPEFIAPLEPAAGYTEAKQYFKETADIAPEKCAEKVFYVIDKARQRGDITAAGYFENNARFSAVGNSRGLFAYETSTAANFSTTIRTNDGTGSARVEREYADIDKLNINKYSDDAIFKSTMSREPREMKPGKYPAILEAPAAADLVGLMVNFMNRRNADEGRNFFGDKESKTKIGKQLVDKSVNIYSDPLDPLAPASSFNREGNPLKRTEWFTEGVLKNLSTSRFWAEKNNIDIVPRPSNVIMKGGTKSLEELISTMESGILVSRLWYIRTVDPQQMLLTGLTRDGIFYVENGEIKYPIKNFRFNESPVNVLKNVVDMSVSEKVIGAETGSEKIVVPALKLSSFNFSTLSDAI